jgi:hypothetical protein
MGKFLGKSNILTKNFAANAKDSVLKTRTFFKEKVGKSEKKYGKIGGKKHN